VVELVLPVVVGEASSSGGPGRQVAAKWQSDQAAVESEVVAVVRKAAHKAVGAGLAT
jgi:hypothetical protein